MKLPSWSEIWYFSVGAICGVAVTSDGNVGTSMVAVVVGCSLFALAKWAFGREGDE